MQSCCVCKFLTIPTLIQVLCSLMYLWAVVSYRLSEDQQMFVKRSCLLVSAYAFWIYTCGRRFSALFIFAFPGIYRVSQEECARLREGVPYVKVYRYNPKHLYPKLNGYGDNGQRKVGASCGSKYCNLRSLYVT